MAKEKYKVVWTKRSQEQMKQVFEYINLDSPKNAEKVVNDIATTVFAASVNPQIYPPDKYKINNDGSYRAFEKHHYRITYRYRANILRVLRIWHTSRKPFMY